MKPADKKNTIAMSTAATGLSAHVSRRLGVCHYCGRMEPMTIDHVIPKRLRHDRHDGSSRSPKVTACVNCNQKKGDRTYEEFRAWLLTEDGYWYLWFRHVTNTFTVQPCEVHPIEGYTIIGYVAADKRERHFCGHKPCGVLRRRLIVIGDGRSVWKDERIADGGAPGRRHSIGRGFKNFKLDESAA
jgi:hypothetical protein